MSDQPNTSMGDRIAEMLAVIEAASGKKIEAEELNERLDELFEATGMLADPSEAGALWQEYTNDQLGLAELAKQFEALACATDPVEASRSNSQVRAILFARLRTRWAYKRVCRENAEGFFLSDLIWADLLATDQEEILDHCRELARNYRRRIKRGAKPKNLLDTLIFDLAEIWCEFTESKADIWELPYSQNSRFIQFLSLAMKGRAHGSETSLSAMSARWRRLKSAENQPLADYEETGADVCD